MDDEGDSLAPGALFKRYGQERKDASNAGKASKESGTNEELPIESEISNDRVAERSSEVQTTLSSCINQASKSDVFCDVEKQQSTSAPISRPVNSNALLVNPKQRGNPILKSVCNVLWEFNDTIIPDYVMGATTCALFLSVRYHNLNPDYIHERLKLLGNQYELRILLVQVDTSDPHHALKHLTRICILANLTLVLAWSPEEAGRILEVYKSFEHKPPDLIMERKESNPHQKIVNALTTIRSVNKTDAATLLSTFGSLGSLLKSSRDNVGLCPGLGPQKANRLFNVLHQPFLKSANASKGTKRKSLN